MAETVKKTRIQLLKNTDSYFAKKNPTTLNGEFYIVEVAGATKFKIGNGAKYNDLPFYEDNLLEVLGFDLDNITDGQILMFNGTSHKWENVDLTDENSIIYLANNGLSIKGYNSAAQGQMLVKDATLGLTWVNPVSDAALQQAVADATAASTQAGNYATAAGNSASEADTSAQTAERINQQTMSWVNNKFWWGTIEEYNNLEEVIEGTYYFVSL